MSDFEGTIVVRRRSPWAFGFALSPFVVALGLVLASLIDGGAWAVGAPHAAILGAVALFWCLRNNPLARETEELVQVREGAVHIGAETLPLSAIASAVLVPAPPFPTVQIQRRGPKLGPMELVVRTPAQGRELLHALGFDAGQRVFTAHAVSWLRTTWLRWTVAIAAAAAAGLAFGAVGAALGLPQIVGPLSAALPLVALASFPTKVHVGGDGVFLEWMRWKKFLPIGEIRSVESWSETMRNGRRVGISITTTDGRSLRLPMGSGWDVPRVLALVERIEEVCAAARRGAPVDPAASALAVEGALSRLARTANATAEWLRGLRALGAGVVATHRVAPIAPETFLRVVEDATARPADRAAAAVALASSGDELMRARIRIVSEAVAEPKLRIALERAVGEDEAALEAAMDELTIEERAMRTG